MAENYLKIEKRSPSCVLTVEVHLQNFLIINKNSTGAEVHPRFVARPPESVETTSALKLCPHEEFLRKSKQRAGKIYPIKEKMGRSRLALIICNTKFDKLDPRDGAEHDITGMRQLLESLDYTVEVKEHLTAKHGEKNPDMLPYDTIFQIFNTRNCPLLKDKPKVIIIQTCRGEKRGEAVITDSPGASTDSSSPANWKEDAACRTHVEKDFIAFYSSTPHTVSWRNILKGSLFITELITCFQNYAWCCHVLKIFQKVQQSFEKRCDQFQMPTIERLSMTKYFYLFPGN